jgi:hypothetical protein
MKQKVTLPQEQQDIVVAALKHYQIALRNFIDDNSDEDLRFLDFDLTQLAGIFKDQGIQVDLEMTEDTHDSFCSNHGVDFPIYVL